VFEQLLGLGVSADHLRIGAEFSDPAIRGRGGLRGVQFNVQLHAGQ
jgi:hypothetical protein